MKHAVSCPPKPSFSSFNYHDSPYSVAAQKWEEKKQMEWSTPKRLRTATGFPLDGGFVPSARPTTTMNSEVRSILSPASSMGGVEEEEDVEDEETVDSESQTRDSYDRPDTPPLSQQSIRSRPVALEGGAGGNGGSGDGGSVGVRRNLLAAFGDGL